jgi:hypothetical protein
MHLKLAALIEDWETMIETNVTGLSRVTRALGTRIRVTAFDSGMCE